MAQALDARDKYTAGHSDRVSINSTVIAEAMRLAPEEIEIIRIGARLHDIGKIGIPDTVLQKPGKLTEDEYALIRLHPQIGKKILEKVERLQKYLPIVELHHEDYDGGGYPYGLHGQSVPVGVRIVHVVDVFDAITSDRAYRKARSREDMVAIMSSESGKQFDPAVLAAFLDTLNKGKLVQAVLDAEVAGTTPPLSKLAAALDSP
jgi:HD-GYP domain-containing protein (c-di-GMP phosphodiesterase class II)